MFPKELRSSQRLEKTGDGSHRKTEKEKTIKEVFGYINAPQGSDERDQKATSLPRAEECYEILTTQDESRIEVKTMEM